MSEEKPSSCAGLNVLEMAPIIIPNILKNIVFFIKTVETAELGHYLMDIGTAVRKTGLADPGRPR